MNQRQTSGPLVSCPGRFPELAIILSSEENVLLEFITGRAGHRKGHSSTAGTGVQEEKRRRGEFGMDRHFSL